jgi:hypothetical protein
MKLTTITGPLPSVRWTSSSARPTLRRRVSDRQESNMPSKSSFTGHRFAFAMTASIVAISAIFASESSLAQTAPAGGTTSIQQGSEKAREMKEPSFQTREERLNAKPLDWNSTLGTPTPRTLTPSEQRTLQSAKPKSSAKGAPNRNAEKEARKLHPDDWN